MNFNRFLAGTALAVSACLFAPATVSAGGPAYPTRVATLATLQGYTAAQMAMYGSFLLDEQVAGNANGSATYLWESSWSGTPDGKNIIAPSDNPGSCSSGCLVATGVLTLKSGLTAITIAASGGTYTTLNAALADLGTQFFGPNVQPIITLNDGTYSESAADIISGKIGGQFEITSQHSYSDSLSSIQSTSGSSGNWSYVLNVGSGANIATGNYIGISGATGGTNPALADGCYLVTNASGTQITVTSPNITSSAPSGSVTGNIAIFKSLLAFTGTDGIDIWNGGSALQLTGNIAIVGNSGATGISPQDVGRLYINGNMCVTGFSTGLGMYLNSEENGGNLFLTGNSGAGISLIDGAVANPSFLIANANGSQGIYGLDGKLDTSSANTVAVANGTSNGFYATNGSVFYIPNAGAYFNANGYGIAGDTNSAVIATNAVGSGNGFSLTHILYQSPSGIMVPGSAISSGIASNGYLGIHTLSPSYYVDIEATTASSGYGLYINDASRTGTDVVADITGASSSENFSVLANGTVELGTTSCSSYLLCIAGSVDISGGNNLTVSGEIIQNTVNGGIVLTSTNNGATATAISINDATRTATDEVLNVTGSGSNENTTLLAGGCLELGATGCSGYLLDVNGNATFSGTLTVAGSYILQSGNSTVSGLPTCNSGMKGATEIVTDASSPIFLGSLTGGSSTVTRALCNGSSWIAD